MSPTADTRTDLYVVNPTDVFEVPLSLRQQPVGFPPLRAVPSPFRPPSGAPARHTSARTADRRAGAVVSRVAWVLFVATIALFTAIGALTAGFGYGMYRGEAVRLPAPVTAKVCPAPVGVAK